MSHRVNAFRRASRIAAPLAVFLFLLGRGGVAFAAHHHLYVGAQADVRIFDAEAVGNVSPERVLFFPRYIASNQIAVDATGEVIACGGYPLTAPAVLVYAPRASGMATPVRDITGPDTTLIFPQGIAVDGAGRIYVDDKMQQRIDVFAPGANGDASPERVIVGSHTLLNKDDGALAVDHVGHIFIEQGGLFLDASQGRAHKDRLLEFAPGAKGDVAPVAAYIPPRGSLENVAVNGRDLLVSVNRADFYGNGELQILSPPTLTMIQAITIPKWQRRLLLGADAILDGRLFALTSARVDDGIWRFGRSQSEPRKFLLSPDGFLGGPLTGFNQIATDVRIGP